jgi:hypothetical protein
MALDFFLGNYKTVSARLGLVYEDARIHGSLDGVPLQIWFGPHAVHIVALATAPAPFELSIVTTSLIDKLADLFGAGHAGIGDPVFDKTFSVKANDVARVSKLLGPEARQALLEAEKAGLHPAVDAHSVHLRRFSHGGLVDAEGAIERDFREAARLGRVLGAAFAHGPYR